MPRRGLLALLISLLCLATAPVSTAQDSRLQAAYRDLASGSDFRVRLAAALTIGKSGDPGARPALEKALEDPHPAVRAGAAAGLGAVGDGAAIAALQRASSKETTASVKSQMESTIKRLSGRGGGKAKYLVALGRIESRVGGVPPGVTASLKSATRTRFAQVPGVEMLAEGADASDAARSRGLPVFFIDGSLTALTKAQNANDVSYSARVEYLIRKIPEQSLKGTISGRAEALADARSVRGQNELAQLQLDAVSAAVDSALKGAGISFEAAASKN